MYRELGFVPDAAPNPLALARSLGLSTVEGLSPSAHAEAAAWYGINLIDVPMPSVPRQLADEILNPFMWFQIFSVVQWLLQTYWHYALIVAFITALAATTSLVISRQNFKRLRELSRHVHKVTVVRGDGEKVVDSTELVPGERRPCLARILGSFSSGLRFLHSLHRRKMTTIRLSYLSHGNLAPLLAFSAPQGISCSSPLGWTSPAILRW